MKRTSDRRPAGDRRPRGYASPPSRASASATAWGLASRKSTARQPKARHRPPLRGVKHSFADSRRDLERCLERHRCTKKRISRETGERLRIDDFKVGAFRDVVSSFRPNCPRRRSRSSRVSDLLNCTIVAPPGSGVRGRRAGSGSFASSSKGSNVIAVRRSGMGCFSESLIVGRLWLGFGSRLALKPEAEFGRLDAGFFVLAGSAESDGHVQRSFSISKAKMR